MNTIKLSNKKELSLAKKRFRQHKFNAMYRNVEFNLTFEQWYQIWQDSGHWENRGRGIGKYCMSRIADSGPYELGNVYINLNQNNASDGNLGKKDSLETRYKKSLGLTGIKRTPEQVEANRIRNLGRIPWNKGLKKCAV